MPEVTVLVVDDDPLHCKMVRDILEGTGYAVVEAADGTEGIAKTEALHPQIILLDLMMPGIDGYEVCRQLKKNPETSAIPIIFVTSSPDVTVDHVAYGAGAVACIRKPFRREALTAVLHAALKTTGGPVNPPGR